MSRAYVLVADDDPLLTELAVNALRREDYEAKAVADGEQALKSLRERRPDLMLLDANMPVLDGFAVLQAIKADAALRHIPVLMLTALRGQADVLRARDLGASDYVAKPFDTKTLVRRVAAAIEKHAPRTARLRPAPSPTATIPPAIANEISTEDEYLD